MIGERGGKTRVNVPCLAEVGRVTYKVDCFLIVDSDNNAALIAKFIFMRLAADHCPCHAGIDAQERVGFFIRAEHGADRANAHNEPGRRG